MLINIDGVLPPRTTVRFCRGGTEVGKRVKSRFLRAIYLAAV